MPSLGPGTRERNHEGFGKLNVAKGATMPRDAIFRIASMTKPVTSVAVMMLLDESKLALDDPISKYLVVPQYGQVLTRVNEADGTLSGFEELVYTHLRPAVARPTASALDDSLASR